MTPEQIIERGRRVLRLEQEALAAVEERLGDSFAAAVTMIAQSRGRVIVPVEVSVAAILRPINPDLPTPVTMTRPVTPWCSLARSRPRVAASTASSTVSPARVFNTGAYRTSM